MKYRIYYTIGDYEDNLILECETIEEIRERVKYELNRKNAVYSYSEKLDSENKEK